MKLKNILEACTYGDDDSEDLQIDAQKKLRAQLDTTYLHEPALESSDRIKNDPCWKGYKMVGHKKKNGKTVPNCVPENVSRLSNLIPEDESPSYMNKSSLEALKANVEYLLSHIDDSTEVDNWAEDHIATAAHDISQVADYYRSKERKTSLGEGSKPAKGKKWKTNGVSHGQKGVRISPGTSRGDAYCARSYGIKGNWRNDPNSPNALSRKKWKCRGKKSMRS